MEQRIIIHVDMDAFFAAIEERENPHFRGKPIVVGAEPHSSAGKGRGRGVVSTANYQARTFGIHSAMPISRAYRLCPAAIYLPPNFELYRKTSENIMKIIRGFSPLVEQVSLDEAYLDASFAKTYSKAKKMAEEMREKIWEQEKLPCSCGIGPSKMIAKIACEKAKPRLHGGQANGINVVHEEEAENFMEVLDIQDIPGVGVKTAAILRGSGIQKVGDVKKLSAEDMESLFGARASAMAKRSRGIDEDAVTAEREVKSIGKETTFERDTRDPELLIRTFEQLVKQAAKEVEEQNARVKKITVVCRFVGFETHTKSKTLREPTQDEAILRSEAMKLLLKFLSEELKPVRLVGARFTIAPLFQL